MQSLIAIVCVRPDFHRLQFVYWIHTSRRMCFCNRNFASATARFVTSHPTTRPKFRIIRGWASFSLRLIVSVPDFLSCLSGLSDAHPHGEALSLRERMILSGVGQCVDFF
jgi:hypothetical protein